MCDSIAYLAAIRRPRLLIRAAHFGLSDYRRNRDLPRVTRQAVAPSPERALATLMEEEERLDTSRRNEEAGYSLARHIDVLIALISEARLIPPAPASGLEHTALNA